MGGDDHAGGDLVLLFRWDQLAHQGYQVRGEERVAGSAVQSEREPLADVDRREPDSLQFGDEDTLRQGSGYSTGPGGGMSEDLWGYVVFDDRQVGDTQSPSRLQHPERLGQHP